MKGTAMDAKNNLQKGYNANFALRTYSLLHLSKVSPKLVRAYILSTKAAAVNFAQAFAQEWEKQKIRVNVINPELTKTPMLVKNFDNEPAEILVSAEKVA
jgi:NAD(P)-dependent dehydrogenase (short-subunit alcohol dehydrogenase family)